MIENFSDIQKIYFVGIGGIAMSAVAGIAKKAEYEVEGSDSKEVYSPAKDILNEFRIPCHIGYEAEHIKKAAADIYILSAGESETNPEVKYILDNNLPRASFPELLYGLFQDKLRVVVAGTHGKSTTSGLLGHLLKEIDDSSFMVGAVLQNENSNFHKGDGHYVVFEGDEYKSQFDDPSPKFHYYQPDVLVLTNLEFDHPDVFQDVEAMEQEFAHLIANMPEDGLIVYNADDIRLSRLVHESNISTVSFGIENEADFKVEKITFAPDFTTFEIQNKFSKNVSAQLLGQTEQYKIQLPGKINIYNALACVATLRTLGFGQEQILLDLLGYKGVKRRFEMIGRKNGITLVDDYAHHPTAVKETLDAARLKYPTAKIWAVFEPHTFSRTKATLPELAKAFGSADEVLISEIYPAREKASDATITSNEVVEAIRRVFSSSPGKEKMPDLSAEASVKVEGQMRSDDHVHLVHNKEEALQTIKSEAKPGDVIITMAVGSFNRLAYDLKERL